MKGEGKVTIASPNNNTSSSVNGSSSKDDDNKKDLSTIQKIIIHATKGAIKSFLIAYFIRGGISSIIKLIQVFKKKISLIEAFEPLLFRIDTIRTSLMFSSFTFIWKLINNVLRLSSNNNLKNSKLTGFISGSIAAGVGICFESKDNRVTFSQQMFVRGMQSYYNYLKSRGIIHLPIGDSLLFIASTASIMYAYILHPTSIPPEYYKWMVNMAGIPKETLEFNRKNSRAIENNTTMDLNSAISLIQKYTSHDNGLKNEAIRKATKVFNDNDQRYPIVPCHVLHPWIPSCIDFNKNLFKRVIINMFPVYASLNFVPLFVFRGKKFVKAPLVSLYKSLVSTVRSSTFLALFVIINMGLICIQRKIVLMNNFKRMSSFLPTVDSKWHYYIFGICCSSSIFLEPKGRRSELALYVLPKGATSLYTVLLNRGYMINFPYFDVLLSSIGVGTLMSLYQNESHSIPPLLVKVMRKIIGKN